MLDLSEKINRTKSLIAHARQRIANLEKQIKYDKEKNIKRDYSVYLSEINAEIGLIDRLNKNINRSIASYSFAEQNDTTITKFQIRESVLGVAKQLKDISAFLLKKIEQEKQLLIDKDYSDLLKKLESSMKLINGEIKLYKDESTWLLAESQIDYGKNEGVMYQIGWKVPLFGRLVDALELQIQKENKDNSAIDHTKLLIKLVDSLKSFDEDLKVYRGVPNSPTIQINKLWNKLTSVSLGSNPLTIELATISVDEYEKLMSETVSLIATKIPEDRNEFHKIILAVQKKENVSYADALNICRYGKK